MKRLLLTCTDLMAIQFMVPHVRYLAENGFEVELACSDVGGRMADLRKAVGDVAKIHTVRLVRSPFSPNNLKGLKDLKKIINGSNWDVIWTNEPVMGLMTRIAAKKARKRGTKVIYMAHGFHFYKGAPKKNWLIFYPIEKLAAPICDAVVTINNEDYAIAKAKFRTNVEHVHGIGANTEKFVRMSDEDRAKLRSEMGYAADEKLILCTGELSANKNQITAIRAMAKVVKSEPKAKLLLAGKGDARTELEAAVSELNLENNVQFLGYRTDLEKFANITDMVISCSIREGLGLNIIEAMLCEKPVVGAINRGHTELIEDGVNGYLVNCEDTDGFAKLIVKMLSDKEGADRMGRAGRDKAMLYTVSAVMEELAALL